jgi:hypothetical protein
MSTVTYAECHTKAPYAECHYAECRYTECRYAECRGASTDDSHFIKQQTNCKQKRCRSKTFLKNCL